MNATTAITLRLDQPDYERLEAEARRQGISLDTLVRGYVRAGLDGDESGDETEAERKRRIGLEALAGLAALRERLPDGEPIDVVQLIREGREDLDRRTTLR